MKLKQIILTIAISLVTVATGILGYDKSVNRGTTAYLDNNKIPINYASFFDKDNKTGGGPVDFTEAAQAATPAVVHIKTKTKAKQITNNLPQQRKNPFGDLFGDDDPFGDFFNGPRMQMIPEQRAAGSGVIISADGYIVTNNHVIDGADELTVTLSNKQTYKAKLVGNDASSDVAVLKIEGKNLPYLLFGNSDDVKLGQWVLAVGYPLNLDVTVTAGIVSAKARSININARQSKTPIESFIQTDAAVNPGNSGGALVNTAGQLIGINSAIASPTGSYAGYSYAIPVNIVKKIVNDLIKFGTVQRAFLGISYPNDQLSDEQKKAAGIKDDGDVHPGVYVLDVAKDGSLAGSGIQKGDYITKINGTNVSSGPEMVEQIASYKPGDKITVTYKRDNKEYTINTTLKNKIGNYDVVKIENTLDKLGGQFENYNGKKSTENSFNSGVLVKKIIGGVLKNTRIQEGFVITSVNGQEVKTIEDLKDALKNNTHIKLEGFYPGYEGVYGYTLNLGVEQDNGDNQ